MSRVLDLPGCSVQWGGAAKLYPIDVQRQTGVIQNVVIISQLCAHQLEDYGQNTHTHTVHKSSGQSAEPRDDDGYGATWRPIDWGATRIERGRSN